MASPPNLQAWWFHLLPESEHDLVSLHQRGQDVPEGIHSPVKTTATEQAVCAYIGNILQHDQVTTALLHPPYSLAQHSGEGGQGTQ